MAVIMASQRCVDVHCSALAINRDSHWPTRTKKVVIAALLPLVLVMVRVRWLPCVVCLTMPCSKVGRVVTASR